ncbi:MAG: PLP-dependent transferase, partial [Pseudomonadota bacterium]
MKQTTAAIHVPGKLREGAIAPPIHLSTTFEHGPANESLHGFEYIRASNPNVDDLQIRLAAIEGAQHCVSFSSGMAAGVAVLQSLPPGSHVVFHQALYFDFKTLASNLLPKWGIKASSIDLTDDDALQQVSSQNPSLIWFETPANPTMDVLDISKICAWAKPLGAKVLVDSTFAPPIIQQPLKLGADYVLHSLTKYMGGHSDVQGGAILFDTPEG